MPVSPLLLALPSAFRVVLTAYFFAGVCQIDASSRSSEVGHIWNRALLLQGSRVVVVAWYMSWWQI
jgi:hypothetical protein